MTTLLLSEWQVSLALGVALCAAGLILLWGCWKVRTQQPPQWVAEYRGRTNSSLAQMGFALAAFLFGVIAMVVWVASLWLVTAFLGMGVLASLGLWLFGSIIYFPRWMLPRWYRRAKRAGVDVRNPDAVQAYRDRLQASTRA